MTDSVGGGGGGNFRLPVTDQGNVVTEQNQEIDLKEPGALEKLEAVLGAEFAEALKELDGVMGARGYKRVGDRYAADDSFSAKGPQGADLGPGEVAGGIGEDEAFVQQAFEDAGIPFPWNASVSPQAHQALEGREDFQQAVGIVGEALTNPTDENMKALGGHLKGVAQDPDGFPGDPYQYVMLALRDSIKDFHEDKKYWLNQVKFLNDMAEMYSVQADQIAKLSSELSAQESDSSYPEKETIEAPSGGYNIYDINAGPGADGQPQAVNKDWPQSDLTRGDIDNLSKEIERKMEQVRNEKQLAMTHFQNIDQKTNQAMNIMTALLKNSHQIMMGVTRNIL